MPSRSRAQGLITLSPDDFSSTIRFVAMGKDTRDRGGGGGGGESRESRADGKPVRLVIVQRNNKNNSNYIRRPFAV